MTTDQKIAHVRYYMLQAKESKHKETKLHYISMGQGAAGAWFADMTIDYDDFKALQAEFQQLIISIHA